MQLRHLLPFAILLAWQAAPTPQPPRTRVSLSLGYAFAEFEEYTAAQTDCSGNQISPEHSEVLEVRSVGARADVTTSQGLRLTAFAGNADSPRGSAAGAFGGAQLGFESRYVALGGGVSAAPSELLSSASSRSATSLYLRFGDAYKTSFRAEWMGPSETFGADGVLRVGASSAVPGKAHTYIGTAFSPFNQIMAFMDLSIPLNRGFDMLLKARVGPGHVNPPWALGIGTSFTLAGDR